MCTLQVWLSLRFSTGADTKWLAMVNPATSNYASVATVPPGPVRRRYEEARRRDVCSPVGVYAQTEVAALLAQLGENDSGASLMDAVLNQHIFPGAGNIIKNEARAKIQTNPLSN